MRASRASVAITSIAASAARARPINVAIIVMNIARGTATSSVARVRITATVRASPSMLATRANGVPAVIIGRKATIAISPAARSGSRRTVIEEIVPIAAASIPMSIARRDRKAARNGPGAGLAAVVAGAELSVGRTDRIG